MTVHILASRRISPHLAASRRISPHLAWESGTDALCAGCEMAGDGGGWREMAGGLTPKIMR